MLIFCDLYKNAPTMHSNLSNIIQIMEAKTDTFYTVLLLAYAKYYWNDCALIKAKYSA